VLCYSPLEHAGCSRTFPSPRRVGGSGGIKAAIGHRVVREHTPARADIEDTRSTSTPLNRRASSTNCTSFHVHHYAYIFLHTLPEPLPSATQPVVCQIRAVEQPLIVSRTVGSRARSPVERCSCGYKSRNPDCPFHPLYHPEYPRPVPEHTIIANDRRRERALQTPTPSPCGPHPNTAQDQRLSRQAYFYQPHQEPANPA
jgi:hypothetical protein